MQAANNTPGIAHVYKALTTLWKHFHYSPKQAECLKEVQSVLELPKMKVIKPSDTHWLAALQERIKYLHESTFTIGEADSEEEQAATRATLRKVVSKLVAAYQCWRDAESMITQISRLERIKKFSTEVALEKFRKFSENYDHLERYSRQIKDHCFKDTWDQLNQLETAGQSDG